VWCEKRVKSQKILFLIFISQGAKWDRTGLISLFLLGGDTNSLAFAAAGLSMLTAHLESPEVTKTSVRTDLLQALNILTELVIESVGNELGVVTIVVVLLSVQEPVGDLVLTRVLEDSDQTLNLLRLQLTGAVNDRNTCLAC